MSNTTAATAPKAPTVASNPTSAPATPKLNPLKLSVNRTAVKFLPQSKEVNKPNARERRGEEKEFLLGVFAGIGEDGQEDAKKLVRVWFTHPEQMKLAWKLAAEGFGCIVIGDYAEKETDYGNNTIGISNAVLAKFNAQGEFSYGVPQEGNKPPIVETVKGTADQFVKVSIETRVLLMQAPTLSEATRPAKTPIGLKARHAAQKSAANNEQLLTDAAAALANTSPNIITA